MTRTDDDRWDLASSVGVTATMVAAARALATAEPDPLINDPFAAGLVRAIGIDYFTALVDGTATLPDEQTASGIALMTATMAVRTKFFDDFFLDAGAAGVRQAVILASGLDVRAYRLAWAAGTVVYEIDQEQVLAGKDAALTALGATPTATRRAVAVDLRDDWPAALRSAGFDPDQPSAWSAEGLLMYLPADAQDRLFDNITALSAPGSRVATEFHGGDFGAALADRARNIAAAWQGDGAVVDFTELFYPGERNHVSDFLRERGWEVHARPRTQVFADYGRALPSDPAVVPLSDSVAVTAVKI